MWIPLIKNSAERFQEAAKQRKAQLNLAFKRAGVDALSLSTEDDLVKAIIGFVKSRQERRK